MTKEQLLNALAVIQGYEHNITHLSDIVYDLDDEKLHSLDDEGLARWSAEEMYSDKLLEELNKRMAYVPVADMHIDGIHVGDMAVEAEEVIGHNINVIAKLHPKKAVKVGESVDSCGSYGFLGYVICNVTYIDEDGVPFSVIESDYSIEYEGVNIGEGPYMRLRILDEEGKPWTLSQIENLLPDVYEGFWNV